MNKNEENNFEVVKDKDGNLHYTHFTNGPALVDDFVVRVGRLRDYVGDHTEVEVLVPPDKYLNGVTNWENGMPNAYNNETADNYNQIKYNQCYVGSEGIKTGIAYGGIDDFTLIYPKFTISYNFYCTMHVQYEFNKTGRFEEALLDISRLYKEDPYSEQRNKYSTYLFDNNSLKIIKNDLNTGGPKVVLIKDSFSLPLAAFLSTVCSEVQLIDPRHYKGDIAEYIKQNNFIYLFISVTPSLLTEEFFPYCKEEKPQE